MHCAVVVAPRVADLHVAQHRVVVALIKEADADPVARLWAARAPRPAIVFVTHDVEEAVYLAGRALVLDAATGRVTKALATPGPLPRAPDWRSDAGFRTAVETLAVELARSMSALAPEAAG